MSRPLSPGPAADPTAAEADRPAHVWAANPLVVDAADRDPQLAARARDLAPTLFAAGDLPTRTLSGIDPQRLLDVPWQARHAVATALTIAEAQRLLAAYADDDHGMAAGYDFAGHPANRDYERRVTAWLDRARHHDAAAS